MVKNKRAKYKQESKDTQNEGIIDWFITKFSNYVLRGLQVSHVHVYFACSLVSFAKLERLVIYTISVPT